MTTNLDLHRSMPDHRAAVACLPRPLRTVALGLGLLFATIASAQQSQPLEGYTEAYRDIHVGSSETSRITAVWAEEGERVTMGQTLVQLDDTVLKAALEVARTAASARGEAEAAAHQLDLRQQRLERLTALAERQHATEQELVLARNERDEAAARVKAFEELQQRRELELRQAELQLARLTIKSPIEGIVAQVLKDVGEVVSPADPKLIQIVQMDPLRIVASGPEKRLRDLEAGMRLPVVVEGQTVQATVEFVSPIVDAQSGMRFLKLRLPNPDGRIAIGVPVEIHLQPVPQAIDREQAIQQTLRQFRFLNRR
ncbi:efflux RND transporter periplasmic adaptor subunit [Roseimaritima sediminicola]|uniref:efflux RND transporter periplasmic adaptor subunit n=1 Tax=Roseimaritima sediminicola TaxID=2662066 RepID=UPI001298308E|nr:efflux RND transporter periplasmic adaptor subunit [Roseimaritima sediminicola]